MRRTYSLLSLLAFFSVCFLTSVTIFGQINSLRVKVRTDGNTFMTPEAEEYKDLIIESIEKQMSLYNEAASLTDLEAGGVTTASVEKFSSLFHSNARVFNDLQKYGTPIPISDYTSIISTKMAQSGVQFKIADMLLIKAEHNPALPGNYFEAKLKVNKLMLNQLDDKTGRVIPAKVDDNVKSLDFTFIIQGKALENVQIYSITGKILSPPKPFNHEFRVAASYGFDINTSYSVHEGFSSGLNYVVTPSLLMDAGVAYSRSFKRGGHAKWLMGVNYGIHSWNVNVTGEKEQNVYSPADNNTAPNKLGFLDSYDYNNVSNNISFSFVQGVIGFQLPLKPILGYRLEYWLEAGILPTWISKKEEVDLENLKMTVLRQVSFEGKAETYCDDIITKDDFVEEYSGRFSSARIMNIGLQIKPGIRYHLTSNKSTALSLGVGYVYYLDSWIDPTSASIHDNLPDSQQTLLLNKFAPGVLRIEAGLSFNLNR